MLVRNNLQCPGRYLISDLLNFEEIQHIKAHISSGNKCYTKEPPPQQPIAPKNCRMANDYM